MPINKCKVIFFVNSYAGGAEKMTANIAGFLDNKQYEVVFYIVSKEWGLIEQFLPKDCRKEYINIKSYNDNLIQKLMKAISIEKPDFVFSSLMPINWRLALASIFFPKVKVILRVNNYLYTQSLIQKIRLFITYRFTEKIILQTEEMKREHRKILKLSEDKLITLANPVNTIQIDNKVKDKVSLFDDYKTNYVYVGRIDKVKGLDILLYAFARICKDQTNACLYIIGETGGGFEPYYKELIEISENLQISNNVIFVGFSDNPYLYVRYADCFVLPSRNEGLPNVVIEALYLGTPVAVTRSVPVIDRIVSHGIDGFVCDVDDDAGLAENMMKAAKLGRIVSSYSSATKEDFQGLFK